MLLANTQETRRWWLLTICLHVQGTEAEIWGLVYFHEQRGIFRTEALINGNLHNPGYDTKHTRWESNQWHLRLKVKKKSTASTWLLHSCQSYQGIIKWQVQLMQLSNLAQDGGMVQEMGQHYPTKSMQSCEEWVGNQQTKHEQRKTLKY